MRAEPAGTAVSLQNRRKLVVSTIDLLFRTHYNIMFFPRVFRGNNKYEALAPPELQTMQSVWGAIPRTIA